MPITPKNAPTAAQPSTELLLKIEPTAGQQPVARLHPDRHEEPDHHDVDGGAGEVEELLDPRDALEEQHDLERGDEDVRHPVDPRHAHEGRFGRGDDDRVDREGHGCGCEVGLRAVPEDRDDAADQRRELRSAHSHARARHHRVRDAVLHARLAGQIHQEVDEESGEDDRGEHPPAVDAGGDEQARRERVAREALDVVGPDVEELERAPAALLLRERSEVFVVQAGVRVAAGVRVEVAGGESGGHAEPPVDGWNWMGRRRHRPTGAVAPSAPIGFADVKPARARAESRVR